MIFRFYVHLFVFLKIPRGCEMFSTLAARGKLSNARMVLHVYFQVVFQRVLFTTFLALKDLDRWRRVEGVGQVLEGGPAEEGVGAVAAHCQRSQECEGG